MTPDPSALRDEGDIDLPALQRAAQILQRRLYLHRHLRRLAAETVDERRDENGGAIIRRGDAEGALGGRRIERGPVAEQGFGIAEQRGQRPGQCFGARREAHRGPAAYE